MTVKEYDKEQQESNSIENWHNAFNLLLIATIIIPLAFLIFQVAFTWNEFVVDWRKIENWNAVISMFGLPIGLFTGLVALTTLIGMYHRSLQLSAQLTKVSKQLSLASNQFKLAENQYELNYTKENFVLYCEHRKQFIERCQSVLDGVNHTPDVKKIIVDYGKFYDLLFPENSPSAIQSFFMVTSRIANDFKPIIPQILDEVNKIDNSFLINYMNGNIEKEDNYFQRIASFYRDLGIFIQISHFVKKEDVYESADLFLQAVFEASILISRVGLIMPSDVQIILAALEDKEKEIEAYKL